VSELSDLLRSRVPVARIEAHLSGLDPGERVQGLADLGCGDQRLLYESARDSPPLDLDFFVPADAPAQSIRHHGTNTLPLPRRLRQFEKRVARPRGESERLFGYNEWILRRLIGPGYFVAKSTADHPRWLERGGVVVDYFEVPEGAVPPKWPDVVPNSHGLQRFRLSRHARFHPASLRRRLDRRSVQGREGARPLLHALPRGTDTSSSQ
jgi:hypothetical protein